MHITKIVMMLVAAATVLVISTMLGSSSVSSQGEVVKATNQTIDATIVKGAATLKDKAFSPNPLNITVGEIIEWTNDDSQKHTVTSGTGSDDPNAGKDFGSDKLSPGESFSYDFVVAGEIPYFCEIHPRMVGKVIVSE